MEEKWTNSGLVPTMGYLHEGHASLIKTSVEHCDKTVVSVFLNPTQFAPNEDLESYPRDFDNDKKLCEEMGADLVFHPEVSEMYDEDSSTFVEILSDMPKQLCGKTRPIHFRGVCTVVSKLFNIVTPTSIFGEKDAQQLQLSVKWLRICPTVLKLSVAQLLEKVTALQSQAEIHT